MIYELDPHPRFALVPLEEGTVQSPLKLNSKH